MARKTRTGYMIRSGEYDQSVNRFLSCEHHTRKAAFQMLRHFKANGHPEAYLMAVDLNADSVLRGDPGHEITLPS